MSLAPEPSAPAADAHSMDVVHRMLEHLSQLVPEVGSDEGRLQRLEATLRQEFGGQKVYVASGRSYESLRQEVLRRFNGRNASTLARELGLGRATVYRWLKQPGV